MSNNEIPTKENTVQLPPQFPSTSSSKRKLETDYSSRGASRTAATFKMEFFNYWKLLTVITKSSILDVATVLDPPLSSFEKKRKIK